MAEPLPSTSSGNDTGLPSNLGAGLCALFPLLGGLVFYFVEKKDAFVRHWAVESIIFGVAIVLIKVAFALLFALAAVLPGLHLLLVPLVVVLYWVSSLAILALYIIGIIKAFQGSRWTYPYVSAQGRKRFPNLVV
jgi:uncharacterized membrane protein